MDKAEMMRQLETLKMQRGWTNRILSQQIGCQETRLSEWIAGKETVKTTQALIEEYLESLDSKPCDRIDTDTLLRVQELCDDCLQFHRLGVVVGNPGSGKTESLKDYAERHENVIYVQCDVCSTITSLAEDILGTVQGTASQKIQTLKLALKGKLLILDEADLLTVRILEAFRAIYDSGKIGMVLAGTPRFLKILTRGHSLKENLSQLYSRVDFFVNVHNPDDEEMMRFLETQGISDSQASKIIRKTGKEISFRAAAKTIQQAKRIAKLNDKAVDKQIVEAAQSMIFIKPY